MTERGFAQYDISLDSQRFSGLVSNEASWQSVEQQKIYIDRQLRTDIGERIGLAESHYIYEIREGKLYGQDEQESFESVIQRGVSARGNREREKAELASFILEQQLLVEAEEGTIVFNPSPPGGGYTENYLDIHRRVGNTVHSVRYLSNSTNQEYREKILSINPVYEEVIPQNPTDLDFFQNPVIVPKFLNFTPDELADHILNGKKGVSKEDFEQYWEGLMPQRLAIINTLVTNPKALINLEQQQSELYKFAEIQIQYVEGATFGGGGCGSGACSVEDNSLASYAKTLGLEPDKYGERVFMCKCGAVNIRWVKDQLISNCQKCGTDEVLPPNLRNSNFQQGFGKPQ